MFPKDYNSKTDPLPPLGHRLIGYAVGLVGFGFVLWLALASL